ncbi:hypothetical protein QAD02_002377 [Eretmocerus hayati]|uniref:Uncharacterized protein n=1 Tax=Eretmocerus hayati TaxID=131215 RepID=A0ACC2NJX5_9HYME|nr:hypothetical protein QAD02_002377 [Eretmocerus hayati]
MRTITKRGKTRYSVSKIRDYLNDPKVQEAVFSEPFLKAYSQQTLDNLPITLTTSIEDTSDPSDHDSSSTTPDSRDSESSVKESLNPRCPGSTPESFTIPSFEEILRFPRKYFSTISGYKRYLAFYCHDTASFPGCTTNFCRNDPWSQTLVGKIVEEDIIFNNLKLYLNNPRHFSKTSSDSE